MLEYYMFSDVTERADVKNVERPNYIPQHFTASIWSSLNIERPGNDGTNFKELYSTTKRLTKYFSRSVRERNEEIENKRGRWPKKRPEP